MTQIYLQETCVIEHIELTKDDKTICVCVAKQFHFDKLEYKDIFYSVRNLRTKLTSSTYKSTELYIHCATINNKNVQKEILTKTCTIFLRIQNLNQFF